MLNKELVESIAAALCVVTLGIVCVFILRVLG
jgi:hypothetical protein